jgi:hypothetical protein
MRLTRACATKVLWVVLLTGLLFSGTEALAAEKAGIQEAFVVNSQAELLLYFSVGGALSPDMEKGILTGIPVTFAFFVELYEHQGAKAPVQIASRSFNHTLHFETLKEVFSLELTEHGKESVIFSDFASAATAMTSVHDLAVANLALLKPGLRYSLKMKARLAKQGLPTEFKNVMTFLKMWDFDTRWRELEFTMPPAIPEEYQGTEPLSSR